MWSRCSVGFCLLLAAQAAVLKTRNIPVEIVYDRTNPATYGTRNLDAKIQLSSDELLKLKLSDDIINEEKIHFEEGDAGNEQGVKNLEEKIQLSSEEIGHQSQNAVEVDGNIKAAVAENSAQSGNLLDLLKRAEEMAYAGINTIRENFDKVSDSIPGAKPTAEAWEKLNQTLHDYFRDQYKNALTLKQDQPTSGNENPNQNQNQNQFFQNLINGIQTISNNFMGNFGQNGQTQKPPGSEDEQQPQQQQQGPWQSFVSYFQGGMNQMVTNMNNYFNRQNGTSGQEDTGTGGNGGSNFINNFVSSIQQFFQGQGGQGGSPSQTINVNNQSDSGVTTNAPGFFQGAINQFNQVVNNFRPSTSARPPVQGDEGSSTTPGNFIQSIGQAFQNVNIFRPQGGQQGGSGGSSNPIQSIGSQFGGQGGNGSNPFVSGAQAIGSQFAGQGGNGSNPFVSGAQAIGSQFGQAIGGQGGQGGGSNPLVSGAQAIGNQFQQAIGQGGNKPVEGGAGEATSEKTRAESLVNEGEKVEKMEEKVEKKVEKVEEKVEKKPAEMMAMEE
ncbi:PE-PGRS family protein PE_PGRS26 [Tribolium castaneum]|uniref:PE-PGRS family protein PE_PGRS26 n=1 Tax=Tribolium castaneum TaxID=7070 RepID=UPI0030FE2ADD